MAGEAAISAIRLQLPDEADDFGLTTEVVGSLLDSGLSQAKVMLAAWRAIAAKAVTIEDVNESGSSRTSRLPDLAQTNLTYWQGISDKEDKAISQDGAGRQRFASHTATRV
jgi:hypothetical protein